MMLEQRSFMLYIAAECGSKKRLYMFLHCVVYELQEDSTLTSDLWPLTLMCFHLVFIFNVE